MDASDTEAFYHAPGAHRVPPPISPSPRAPSPLPHDIHVGDGVN